MIFSVLLIDQYLCRSAILWCYDHNCWFYSALLSNLLFCLIVSFCAMISMLHLLPMYFWYIDDCPASFTVWNPRFHNVPSIISPFWFVTEENHRFDFAFTSAQYIMLYYCARRSILLSLDIWSSIRLVYWQYWLMTYKFFRFNWTSTVISLFLGTFVTIKFLLCNIMQYYDCSHWVFVVEDTSACCWYIHQFISFPSFSRALLYALEYMLLPLCV